MTQHILKKTSDLSPDNSSLFLQGFFGTANAGQTTTVEWEVPTEFWMNGAKLAASGQVAGDKFSFYVVIKVEDQDVFSQKFASDIYVVPGTEVQIDENLSYLARVPAGAFLRIVYTSIGTDPVNLFAMFRTHKPKDVV